VRFSTPVFWFALLVALVSAAPLRAAAPQPAPAPTAVPELLHPGAWMPSGVFLKKTPPFAELCWARDFWNRSKASSAASPPRRASAPAGGSAAAQAPQSVDEVESAFLHGPTVQSLARILHLSLETTIRIFLGINFAIIALFLVLPLRKVMPQIIRKRSQTLRRDLQAAREATADANARLSAVEAKLAGLGAEIEKFRTQVEQEGLEEEKRVKAALGEESARIVAAAGQEIGAAAAQARRGLRNFAADLAIERASKQLALTPETDRALIAEFIAGVAGNGQAKGGKN
jgi:F-type H+-transporting ATPase subunit b